MSLERFFSNIKKKLYNKWLYFVKWYDSKVGISVSFIIIYNISVFFW